MQSPTHQMDTKYASLPVMVDRLRRGESCQGQLRSFLKQAKDELVAQDQRFLEMRTRYFLQLRSRRERLQVGPCFEAEEAILLHSRLALEALEIYLKTPKASLLREAMSKFEASEAMFQKLIKLRLRLAAGYQEDLQRAA